MDIITHGLGGFLTSKATLKDKENIKSYTLFFTLAALAPDIDSAWNWINYESLHRVLTHSAILAPLFALVCAYVFFLFSKKKLNLKKLYIITLAGILIHILFDYFTVWGVPVFWPILDNYFSLNLYTYVYDPLILPIGIIFFLGFITNTLKLLPHKAYIGMGIYLFLVFATNIGIKSYVRINLEEKPDLLVPFYANLTDFTLHNKRKAIYIEDNSFRTLYTGIGVQNYETTKNTYTGPNICSKIHNGYLFQQGEYVADVRFASTIEKNEQYGNNCFLGQKLSKK